MSAIDSTLDVLPARGPWYRIALRCAGISGLTFVFVCGMVVVNWALREPYNPLETVEFKALKAQLAASPRDEALKARIRELDLRLRQTHFRRLDLSGRGAYLLLGSLLVFVLSMKWVFACRRPLPMPAPPAEEEPTPFPVGRSLASAAVFGLAIAGLAAGLALTYREVLDAPSAASLAPTPEELARAWPRFRGPGGRGVSTHSNVPISFDVASGKGVIWKTPVPLPGQNSPILFRDRIFLTGATEEKREVYAIDAITGELLWQGAVGGSGPAPKVLPSTGYAASTAATDGLRVFAVFATGQLAAFDLGGRKLWEKGFGPFHNEYGYGTSLATHGKLLYVLLDQGGEEDGESRLLALDAVSGTTVWEARRPVAASWATPIVVSTPGGDQLITSANPWVIAYSPTKGTELWKANVMGGDVAPSPVATKDLVLAVNLDAELVAIRPDGSGDVTETHVAWRGEEGLPDICSPVTDGERAFLLTTSGKVTCYRVSDGKVLWEEKLKMSFNASPTLVGGLLYLLSQKGVLVVAESTPAYKEVARSALGEEANASPAFADGRLYLRGATHLWCLGTP